MSNYGLFCPVSPGHLNPMLSLATELSHRGHSVTLFGALDALDYANSANIKLHPIAEKEYPIGTISEIIQNQGKLQGMNAVKYTLQAFNESAKAAFAYLPDALIAEKIDVMIVDQVSSEAATVSEYLNIPYVTVCNALMVFQEPAVPPICFTWSFNSNIFFKFRNIFSYQLINLLTKPLQKTFFEQRSLWNLEPYRGVTDSGSKILQISQQPKEFEFPRSQLPLNFYFTNPFFDQCIRPHIEFPFDRLNGKPIIYASLGTVQNNLKWVFGVIAEACSMLDVQLILTKGSKTSPVDLSSLPGDPIVVDFAPQLELLKIASLTITHGGMNTVLESLAYGVPMVAIPITNDQPGIASRIRYTCTGDFITLKNLNSSSLSALINNIISDDKYRQNALTFSRRISSFSGRVLAVDLIEKYINLL